MRILSTLIYLHLFAVVGLAEEADAPALDLKEYQAGVASAVKDLSEKTVRYGIVGQPRLIDKELKQLAEERYGIEVILHGCIVPPREDYREGYRNTVLAFLKKKHGSDPVAALAKEIAAKSR